MIVLLHYMWKESPRLQTGQMAQNSRDERQFGTECWSGTKSQCTEPLLNDQCTGLVVKCTASALLDYVCRSALWAIDVNKLSQRMPCSAKHRKPSLLLNQHSPPQSIQLTKAPLLLPSIGKKAPNDVLQNPPIHHPVIAFQVCKEDIPESCRRGGAAGGEGKPHKNMLKFAEGVI